jgi:hypothetical protein
VSATAASDSPAPQLWREAVRLVSAVTAVALYCVSPTAFTSAALHIDWPWDGFLTLYAGGLLVGVALLVVLPMVSYRRRDIFILAFVPIYPIVLAAKVGWRVGNLPHRDWKLRPDELTDTST